MRKKTTRLGWGALFTLVLTAGSLFGQYKVVGEKGDFYFGHISYVETAEGAAAPTVFRLDARAPEAAVLNLPLGPGDMIQTAEGSRCEVQFDNGTIVRLDFGTKLKIETILAQALSTSQKVSNLLLAQGQVYVMYRKHSSLEIFQVMTPAASIKFRDSAVAVVTVEIGLTTVGVQRGRTDLLFGPNPGLLFERKAVAGESIAVAADNVPRAVEPAPASAFLSWNEKVNADFKSTHAGNALPKPLQKLPPAVFEFAQKFGNLHGEWLWHDLYGYVWRPYINDLRYPWGTWPWSLNPNFNNPQYAWGGWQPYFYGDWSEYNGQLYWVPGESWGWVPYHLGLWMWDKKSGWVWMPGSLFAPAWVDWAFWSDHYLWRPYTLFDFFEGCGGGAWLWDKTYDGPWTRDIIRTGFDRKPGDQSVRGVIDKDSLKRKAQPALPVPKEMKTALRLTAEALKRGDPGAQESLRETMRRSVVISKGDFAKPGWQDKTVTLDRFLERPEVRERGPQSFERIPSELVARDALRSVEAIRTIREVKAEVGPELKNPSASAAPGDPRVSRERPGSRPDAVIQDRGAGEAQPAPSAKGPGRISRGENPEGRGPSQFVMRFRDWNPDVRTAVRMGVDINYSSRTNEVYSRQLGLRSRDIIPRARFSSGTQDFPSASGAGTSSGGGSSVAGSPGSGTGSSSSPSGSSGPRGSSKESGGGKQKN